MGFSLVYILELDQVTCSSRSSRQLPIRNSTRSTSYRFLPVPFPFAFTQYNLSTVFFSLCLFPLPCDKVDTVAALADPNELFLPGERQSNLAMSSSVPLLRPPIPGARNNNGSPRAPELTLGIPPSPSAKPVTDNPPALVPQQVPQIQTQPTPQPQRASGRPAPPRLQLATPSGSQQNVSQPALMPSGRPAPPPLSTNGLGGAPKLSLQTSSTPANSYTTANFVMGLRQPDGSSDPSSAISSVYSDREGGDRDNSVNGLLPDLDKLSLEKGRPLDVDDLDDEGWHAASEQNKIVELGSLGEGAGGAVTRCRLKEGKTVFALKVSRFLSTILHSISFRKLILGLDHHHGS